MDTQISSATGFGSIKSQGKFRQRQNFQTDVQQQRRLEQIQQGSQILAPALNSTVLTQLRNPANSAQKQILDQVAIIYQNIDQQKNNLAMLQRMKQQMVVYSQQIIMAIEKYVTTVSNLIGANSNPGTIRNNIRMLISQFAMLYVIGGQQVLPFVKRFYGNNQRYMTQRYATTSQMFTQVVIQTADNFFGGRATGQYGVAGLVQNAINTIQQPQQNPVIQQLAQNPQVVKAAQNLQQAIKDQPVGAGQSAQVRRALTQLRQTLNQQTNLNKKQLDQLMKNIKSRGLASAVRTYRNSQLFKTNSFGKVGPNGLLNTISSDSLGSTFRPSLNLKQLQSGAHIKNGLFVYPQWAMATVDRVNKKQQNRQLYEQIANSRTLTSLIQKQSTFLLAPKLFSYVNRRLIGTQPSVMSMKKIQNTLTQNTPIIKAKLTQAGIDSWVPPVIKSIVQANDDLHQNGFGQINKQSLPLYVGRFIDAKGNIRTLPNPSSKFLNPLSRIQKQVYLQGKILYNWNRLVRTVDQWNQIKNTTDEHYSSIQGNKIARQLKTAQKTVPKFRGLMTDITLYNVWQQNTKSKSPLQMYKLLFWQQVFGRSANAQLKQFGKQLKQALAAYNQMFMDKKNQQIQLSKPQLVQTQDMLAQRVKNLVQSIIINMQPADSTYTSINTFAKQARYALSLVNSVLIKKVNAVYNSYKASVLSKNRLTAAQFQNTAQMLGSLKDTLRKDISKGQRLIPNSIKTALQNGLPYYQAQKTTFPRAQRTNASVSNFYYDTFK